MHDFVVRGHVLALDFEGLVEADEDVIGVVDQVGVLAGFDEDEQMVEDAVEESGAGNHATGHNCEEVPAAVRFL